MQKVGAKNRQLKGKSNCKTSSLWDGTEVIGYADVSRTEIFSSSRMSTERYKVLVAQGVKRFVEVTLTNFEDRSNFSTFL